MTENKFLSVLIPFSQQNHCSVFFAHLQNLLKKVSVQAQATLDFSKICFVINDIYQEHSKLETAHEQLRKSLKDLMTQFSSMLTQCKQDREKLMKASQDKCNLLQKLNQCNQDAIVLSNQNSILKQTVSQLKQINELLTEKNTVVEEQLANRNMNTVAFESYNRISTQYDRLLQSNGEIRRQLIEIHNQSQALQEISKPMQIISSALVNNPKLRDEIWEMTERQMKALMSQKQVEKMKISLYSFNFDNFLKKVKSGCLQ